MNGLPKTMGLAIVSSNFTDLAAVVLVVKCISHSLPFFLEAVSKSQIFAR